MRTDHLTNFIVRLHSYLQLAGRLDLQTPKTSHFDPSIIHADPYADWSKRGKRTLTEAVKARYANAKDGSSAVETVLGCNVGEKACEIGGTWTCTE